MMIIYLLSNPWVIVSLAMLFLELTLYPRPDWTSEKQLLLWYGRKRRKYITLIK